MGARPVRRLVQQEIEEPLSDALLANEFKAGDTILIDAEEQPGEDEKAKRKIVLKHNHPEPEIEKPELVGM